MDTDIPSLVEKILKKRSEVRLDKSVLVAVSSIDGSGKGYITEKIVAETNRKGIRAIAINIDPWLAPPGERFNPENPGEHFYRHAFQFDDIFKTLICPLKENRAINLTRLLTGQLGTPFVQTYDFQNVDVIVLEGIFLLKRSLRHYYDLTFWIECSFETALQRALQRNQENLPPDSIVRDYHNIYFPAQKFHFAVDSPLQAVDATYVNDSKRCLSRW